MKDKKSALVSVLMPVYNCAMFLEDTIINILSQTYKNIELIMVDDGSTDNSLNIASKYKNDNRVKIFSQSNSGAAAARNKAFKESSGEYIMYMDADDLISKEKIENQINILTNEDELALCSCQWDIFYKNPKEAKFPKRYTYRNYSPSIDIVSDMLNIGEMMQTSVWIGHRKLFEMAGEWDPAISINDDGVYFTKVITLASQILFCHNAYVYYRRGHSSLSTSNIYSQNKLSALLMSYEAQSKLILSNNSSSNKIRNGIARNFALIMCKSQYGSQIYIEAKLNIEKLGLKPTHPFKNSKAYYICKIIGFENYLRIRSYLIWKK